MLSEPVIVACLGSSSTAGKGQAFDWISELERRPGNERFRFHNFGVGGDLAYNALQRLPSLLACHPTKVVIWIGGNDVLTLVSNKVRRFFQITKHLPFEPSPEWFRECIQTITRRVKAETSASVGFCSLPPIGEDPVSANPFQSEINWRIEEFNSMIRVLAQEEGVSYIAIHEAIQAQILASPGQAFTCFRFLPFYRDAFRVLVLHKTHDEVAQKNRWLFHTDGVHLNSRGGMIAVNLVQEFIEK